MYRNLNRSIVGYVSSPHSMLEVSLGSLFKSHILLVTEFSHICNSKMFHFEFGLFPLPAWVQDTYNAFIAFISLSSRLLYSLTLLPGVSSWSALCLYTACLVALIASTNIHKYTCYKVQIPLFPVPDLVALHLFLSFKNPSTFTLQRHCPCHSLLLICSSLFISISFHFVAFFSSSFKVHLKWLLFYETILAPTPATEQMMLSSW